MHSVTGCLRDRKRGRRKSGSELIKMATGREEDGKGEDERWMVDTKLS